MSWRVRAVLLGFIQCVSAQHRRASAKQLAGVHPGNIRMHDSVGGFRGGVWNAGAERTAAALSPSVQRRQL